MYRIIFLFISFYLVQCQPKEPPKEFSFKKEKKAPLEKASTHVDLKNKGIGPVTFVDISQPIDSVLVNDGIAIYSEKCLTCHKIGEAFIGPPPNGILKRRSPEWVMNFILNTAEMLQKDSLAKALFMEYNGQLMTDQHLSEVEARSILEYFRTLD